jgi:hypothetical protein
MSEAVVSQKGKAGSARGRSAGMGSRIHDTRYQELYIVSIPFIVLVFTRRAHCFESSVKRRKQRGRARWGWTGCRVRAEDARRLLRRGKVGEIAGLERVDPQMGQTGFRQEYGLAPHPKSPASEGGRYKKHDCRLEAGATRAST